MSNEMIPSFHDVKFEIVDSNGEQWITVKQLAEALGYSHQDKLTQLFRRNHLEFQRKLYTLKLSGGRGGAETIINYHGVIRAAMLSNTARACEFRDYAETVLYEHMTGRMCVRSEVPTSIEKMDRLERLAENFLELQAIQTQTINDMSLRLTNVEIQPRMIAASLEMDTSQWLTAGQYVRQVLRSKNLPKGFNSGAAFDNWAANEHDRVMGGYPRKRSRRHIGKLEEYVYPPGAESSVFLRTTLDKYLHENRTNQQRTLTFRTVRDGRPEARP